MAIVFSNQIISRIEQLIITLDASWIIHYMNYTRSNSENLPQVDKENSTRFNHGKSIHCWMKNMPNPSFFQLTQKYFGCNPYFKYIKRTVFAPNSFHITDIYFWVIPKVVWAIWINTSSNGFAKIHFYETEAFKILWKTNLKKWQFLWILTLGFSKSTDNNKC